MAAAISSDDDQRPRTRGRRAALRCGHAGYASRCTVAGEKAGRQTATYSAPPALGLRVADPLARPGHDRLAGPHVQRAALVLDAQQYRAARA